MLDAFFDLTSLVQLLVLIVGFSAVFASSVRWMRGLGAKLTDDPSYLPAPPTFMVVPMIFGLFLTFLANDVWIQQRAARDAAIRESLAFERLSALWPDSSAEKRRGLTARYKHLVLTQEWGRHKPNAAHEIEELLEAMRALPSTLRLEHRAVEDLGDWGKNVADLEDARARRLQLAADHTDDTQWLIVLVLAVLSHLAIASVNADRWKGGSVVIMLFSLSCVFALWQVARHTNPYAGGDWRIEPLNAQDLP